MSVIFGKDAETKAVHYLTARGLALIQRNYRCRLGEIDLIMQQADCVVFVEVRQRSYVSYGGALASVTLRKQQKIIRTAQHFLALTRRYERQPMRFDVLGFDGTTAEIVWVKNAFGADF